MLGAQLGGGAGDDGVVGFLKDLDLDLKSNCKSFGWGKDSTNIQRGVVYGMTLNFHVNNVIGLIWPQCV